MLSPDNAWLQPACYLPVLPTLPTIMELDTKTPQKEGRPNLWSASINIGVPVFASADCGFHLRCGCRGPRKQQETKPTCRFPITGMLALFFLTMLVDSEDPECPPLLSKLEYPGIHKRRRHSVPTILGHLCPSGGCLPFPSPNSFAWQPRG